MNEETDKIPAIEPEHEPAPELAVEPHLDAAPEPVIDADVDAQEMDTMPATAVEPEPVIDADVEAPATAVESEPVAEVHTGAADAMAEPVVDADVAATPDSDLPDTPTDAGLMIDGKGEDADAIDEDIVIVSPNRRASTAKKAIKAKTPKTPKAPKTEKEGAPKRTSKKKIALPDLGDGSGYIQPEAYDIPEDGSAWYAVHCYSGQENKVKTNLEQRIETMGMAGKILKVIVPTEDEIEVRDGKRKTIKRQVFPGYVLVQMNMSEESWFVVRNTPGVTRFIGMGNRPQPLGPQEVNVLLGRMEAEAPKIKVNFRPGQKVRITDGPFADFIGVVDKIDTERAKVVALVSFFGRETPVELDFLQVEKT
jgi:transcription termination/antitermination protein NusG